MKNQTKIQNSIIEIDKKYERVQHSSTSNILKVKKKKGLNLKFSNSQKSKDPNVANKFFQVKKGMTLFSFEKTIIENKNNSKIILTDNNNFISGKETEIKTEESVKIYPDNSLNLFSIDNKLRGFLIKILSSHKFTIILNVLIVIQSIAFAVINSTNQKNSKSYLFQLNILDIVSLSFYLLEFLLKLISYGFYEGTGSYYRNYWNFFDSIVILLSIFGLIIETSFTYLRIFRLLNLFENLHIALELKTLINFIFYNSKNLSKMITFTIFIIIFFSVISVGTFGDIYNLRCRESLTPEYGRWSIPENNDDLCGGWNDCKHICGDYANLDKTALFFKNPHIKIKNEIFNEKYNFGYTTFNGFFNSARTFYLLTTREGWTQIMYNLQNSYNFVIGTIFMISAVLTLNYLIINFSVAIIMGNFRIFIEHEEISNDENFILKRENERIMLKKVEDSENLKKVTLMDFLNYIKNKSLFAVVKPTNDYNSNSKIAFFFLFIVNQPIFNYIKDSVIIINTIAMSMNSIHDSYFSTNFAINIIFIVICSLESFFKLIGYGKSFFSSGFNLFEVIILIISILEFSISNQLKFTSSVSSLRILIMLNYIKEWNMLRIILLCLKTTIKNVGNYFIVLFLIIYFFSLIGMSFFKGKLFFNEEEHFDPRGHLSEFNFENFQNSAISVFTILIGSGWLEVLFTCLKSNAINPVYIYLFFPTSLAILTIVIFMIIIFLLVNFEKSRKDILLEIYKNEFQTNKVIKKSNSFDDFMFKKIKKTLEGDIKTINPQEFNQALYQISEEDIQEINSFAQINQSNSSIKEIAELRKNNSNKNADFINKVFEKDINRHSVIKFKKVESNLNIDTSKLNARISHNLTNFNIEKVLNSELGNNIAPSDKNIENPPKNKYQNKKSFTQKFFKSTKSFTVIQAYKNKLKENKVSNNVNNEPVVKFKNISQFRKYIKNSSLCIFNISNSFRRFLIVLVQNKNFERIVLLLITISISLGFYLESPESDKTSKYYKVIHNIHNIMNLIFALEIVLRVIAFGFYFDNIKQIEIHNEETEERRTIYVEKDFFYKGENYQFHIVGKMEIYTKKRVKISEVQENYGISALLYDFMDNEKKTDNFECFEMKKALLKDYWNLIDCIIVLSSLIEMNFSNPVSSYKILREIQTFRPLRIAVRLESLQLLLKSLILTIPSLGSVFLVASFVFLSFAILGVGLFKGVLGVCSNSHFHNYSSCIDNGYLWKSNDANFDNVLNALIIIFQLSVSNNWTKFLFITVHNTSYFSAFYFVVIMVFGNLFLINFTISIIVNNFFTISNKEEGIELLTEYQREWIKLVKFFLNFRPKFSFNVKFSKHRKIAIKFYSKYRKMFKIFKIILISLNIISMSVSYESSSIYQYFDEIIFNLFFFYFNIEVILKIIMKRKYYFNNEMKRIDTYNLIVLDILVLIDWLSLKFPLYKFFFNTFRAFRIFYIMNSFLHLRKLINAVKTIIYSLLSILLLILILLAIYGSLGMIIFGTTKYHEYNNPSSNFNNMPNAIFVLISCSTGEKWNLIMNELATKVEGCIENQDDLSTGPPNQCGTSIAYLYFISFTIISLIIIMNLFVSIIIDTYLYVSDHNIILNKDDIKQFFILWGKYDLNGSNMLNPTDYVLLMKELNWPLGFNKQKKIKKPQPLSIKSIKLSYNHKFATDDSNSLKILRKLDIICRGKKINIIDAIKLIAKRSFKKLTKIQDEDLIITNKQINDKLLERFILYDTKYQKHIENVTEKNFFTGAHIMASNIMINIYRTWKNKKKNLIFTENNQQKNNENDLLRILGNRIQT